MTQTRARLLDAAAAVVREQGTAAASARVIAARAEVNQALVFYHFGTVAALVDQACRAAVDDALAGYRPRLDGVTTVGDLLALARDLREQERGTGNVAMMAQLMAGARTDPVLAGAAQYATQAWVAALEPVVERVLEAGALGELVDPADLARAVAASFIGLELVDAVDTESATRALAVLGALAALIGALDALGPIGRRAVRAAARVGGR